MDFAFRRRPAETLGDGLRRGQPAAFDAIYREHTRTVLAYLISTLRDRAAAEDVHQQVFAELWRRRSDYDPARGSLFTWIMTLARSRAIDHLRRRSPEAWDPVDAAELADRRDGQVDSPEDAVERWRVAQLLARLPQDERSVLRMRFYHGLSQSEIAGAEGVPLGTVKSRMTRALSRLREMMTEEEHGPPEGTGGPVGGAPRTAAGPGFGRER